MSEPRDIDSGSLNKRSRMGALAGQSSIAIPSEALRPEAAQDIAGLEGWSDVSEEAARDLVAGARLIEVSRGEDIPTDIGVLLSGIAGVRREHSDGRRLYCSLFHRGDLFDLRREARQRQGLVLAVTDVRVLCLKAAIVNASAHAHPELAEFLIRQLREYAARLRDHCSDIVFKTPLERLASVLLELRRWPGVADDAQTSEHFVLTLPITRADIASYIGMKPETVSRGLQQLAREGVIRKAGRNTLNVLDVPALRTIANGGRPRGAAAAWRR